ncbi:hypothetical protein AOXY_G3822 [Acipenser oxyrinchus oxyrinchus]|uniref:Uncharacterized protein n=1 Tax=Acipenser oxyrinchus oxyrinchus TaxID=40147 RepID=A0AAD8LTK9_ACIOX|nr:hypothetical protein AOXY_G3822 [Acipenser oxyrinchus oxyrinchus]
MVFIFELFLLPGTNIHMNQVVGWGAFPVCDSQFETLDGKFKCPLLRGYQDPRIDQFRKIEELISYDLDNWLCTIYFQVIKLPQSGQKEYEVTLQIPPHVHQSSDCFYACEKTEEGQKGCNTQESTLRRSQLSLSASCRCSSSYLQGKVCDKSKPENAKKTSDQIYANEENGMYYKKESNPHLKAGSSSEDSVKDFQYCSYADKLEEYGFSLRPQHSCSGKACGRDAERTHFVLRMFLSELGLSQWRSQEFWFIMLLLALIWFVRLYLHYCSQWLFLQAISVPVNKFYFYPHTVELSYQNSLLHTREELAMVVVGPLTLNVVMLLMVLIRWGCQLIFGSFPSFLSKFIMAIGLWTLLDPLAVFVVDAFLGHLAWSAEKPIADAAKLYWLFYRTQHSGTPGVIITVFLYIVILICSLTILYMYFLRLHNGGRMLDVFQRVQSEEARFFVPLDMEVSNQELSYIVKKAEQWRGINGERRKVAVYDYIWTEDPSVGDPSCDPQHRCETSGFADGHKEITTHVSIYTIHLSGLRNLYRHFLRLPDGAIVEVTGDISGINVLQREVNAVLHKNINEEDSEPGPSSACELRERKKKVVWRSPRVEPAGRSCLDSMAVPIVSKR